jgi:microcystin-dependent protein
MEGTMSEIRMFAGPFEPKTWAYCAGQLLSINTNQALFSLLGTMYGGNGVQTFALPDMRGRVPVGTGTAPAVSSFKLGEMTGTPTATATLANLPAHMHYPVPNTAVNIPVYSDSGDSGSPSNTNLAALQGLYSSATPDTTMRQVQTAVNISAVGSNQPINIEQPYLGMNYIICLWGIFPSRG